MATKQKVQLLMPEMGESVTEGTVLEWHVSEGDSVEEGQTMVEVSTDKVDAEVPAPASGTVTKILVQPDDEIEVGKPMAEIDPNGGPPEKTAEASDQDAESNGAGAAAAEEAQPDTGGEKATTDDASVSAGKSLEGGGLEIVMPEMGESVTEGTVLEWHVSEGGQIAEGDTVVEVSTDKVDAEVPAPASGTITKILVGPDETVEVGKPLAEMTKGEADATRVAKPAAPAPDTAAEGEAVPGDGEAAQPADGARATPVARRAAQANGVDLKGLKGSGAGGKITKSDVLSAEGNGAAAPGAIEGETRPLRGPAASLARAMNESRSIPTATSFRELAVDTLDAKRKALNEVLKERGMKVSFTHLIAWAIVKAAQEWPVMARHYEETDGKPTVVEAGSVNLGIAVDVERKGQRSLMVPCIKGSDRLDFAGFHSYYEELITKTRENSLTADDFQGTNISLTNPGGLGTVASVPRLMSGQGTIIACGSLAYPVEWGHAPPEKIKALGVSKVMTMTSTYDHRVIQGAESGSFLRRIEELLQGEDNFYESVATDLGLEPSTVTAAHAASASAPPLSALGAPGEAAPSVAAKPNMELLQAVQAATSLLKAYRTHGHLAARLDPLGSEPKGDPAIQPENVGLTPELMSQIPAEILRIGVEGETLLDALPRMREAYCGTIAYQIEHLSSHQQRMWLRDMIETGWHRKPLDPEEKHELLERLIQVFGFERYLEKAYLGQKMFSVEGLDTIVPMLDEVFEMAHTEGAHDVVIGMAHRGRLAVLAHNIGRPVEAILAEFEGAKAIEAVKSLAAIPTGGTGDVKYHYGHNGVYKAKDGSEIGVRLYPNPSHLEYVDPVVTGAARASQTTRRDGRLEHDPMAAVPILLHGDAAFPAQGVVAETLNLQSLKGYATGGSVHIIQNNQIGFTTDPEEGRSTPYAADMAKGFNVPIVHVNADDPEACLAAVRLAMAYRERWGRDVVIDLIGYRRFGHNETDEPAYTQPLMAAKIKEHPPVSQLYAEELVKEGIATPDEVEERNDQRQKGLKSAHDELRAKIESGDYADPTATGTSELDRTRSPSVDTAVPEERLRKLNEELLRVPDSFTIHRKLRKPLSRRLEAMDEGGIEFGHAEALALGSLLTDGVHVRFTGQDTERGTFSHRHLVLHDEKTGLRYAPVQNLPEATAPLELHNSPLSESACLGFEYGYSAHSPDSLVLWEAQFGDFGNAAQVIIDSFIVSAEAKWGQTSRLTLLLPHGYEGAGPEHSSARIERFIQLAAEGNIRIANPSTAAQYFHLLRRQAHIAKARPMVVFTPKGLLRLPRATSTLEELTSGSFEFVLDDPRAEDSKKKVERLVLCSGKIYYDIDAAPKREEIENVAIARVELLYPFAKEQLTQLIASYPKLKEIVWVQEEPRNMGAWSVMQRRMPELLPEGVELGYVGRPPRASPGEGYAVAHTKEQERIVLTALMGRADPA
ncbi:MAG TPA: multifunctional oxoglutarate decarboxylase/oxoglutarate dehydrogenase thiamine pyrophosphate-binding subunit/dihydrolipoyllysine-residue succinyltransferase subunit [Solirubrobacterales bacterium]